jgi:phosphatidylglycerophosphate synthase
MAAYHPTSRRPIADVFRRFAQGSTDWCVARGIHPDAVSYASIVAAAAAASCFWQSGRLPLLLIPAALFCYVRLWLNMLDGMVALASHTASLRGEILNDLPDRVSDVLIFVGAAHSGLCHPVLGYWTAIFALLVAYVGMFGQAVGVQREFSGVMAKPWRMVALHVGAWLTLALLWSGKRYDWRGLTTLDWTFLAVITGCVQTIWIRLARILRALKEKQHASDATDSAGGN